MNHTNNIRPGWGVVPIGILLGVWELTARLNILPGQLFIPPFSQVIREAYHLIVTGVLVNNFLSSLARVLIGFFAGSIAGLLIGVAMGWETALDRAIRPIVSLLYPIPALGWLPLLMLWIGINEVLPIAIVFICSFFPVCYTTATGIKSVERKFAQAARTLGASELRVLLTVVLPLALPSIFTGLRLEAGMVWRVIIAAEMVAIPTGMGALLMRAESLIRVDIIIICLMVLSLMCFSFDRLLGYLEGRLTARWICDAHDRA
jgi:NitT/TauT family transport system permease protein